MKRILFILLLLPAFGIAQWTNPLPQQGLFYTFKRIAPRDAAGLVQTCGLPNKDSIKYKMQKTDDQYGIDTCANKLWIYYHKGDSVRYYNSGSAGGTGSPNTSVGGGYDVAKSGSNVVRTLIPGFGFAIDSATNTLNLRVDSNRVVPVPLILIAGGALTWDGAGWRTKQAGLSDALTNDNCYTSNGYQICITGNGIQITDTATGTQNFVFGTNGIRNDYYNDGTGIARMMTITNGVVGYQNIPSSGGGGGGTGKNYYAGQGLILNDSVFAVNNAYFDGRYVSLTGTYNNPTWLNTLAYSKLTGVPDFAGTYVPYENATRDLNLGNNILKAAQIQAYDNMAGLTDDGGFYGGYLQLFANTTHTVGGLFNSSSLSALPDNNFFNYNLPANNGTLALTPNADGSIFPTNSAGYLQNDGNGNYSWQAIPSSSGRTYYAQEPIYKANDSTFAIRQASGSQAGALSAVDWGTFSAKEPAIAAGTTSQYWRGDKTFQTLDKNAVGLGNVDNTSDANKPISTATQTALNGKQGLLTLTTTGTSGAATLSGNTLNIPNYATGGSTFTETTQTFTDLSNTKTLTNTPKTGYTVKVFVNGVKYNAGNISVTGTTVTLAGYTLTSGDVVDIIYNY